MPRMDELDLARAALRETREEAHAYGKRALARELLPLLAIGTYALKHDETCTVRTLNNRTCTCGKTRLFEALDKVRAIADGKEAADTPRAASVWLVRDITEHGGSVLSVHATQGGAETRYAKERARCDIEETPLER